MGDVLSCSFFPVCSGCSAIGRAYDDQLAEKRAAVCDLFASAAIPGFSAHLIKSITPSPRTSGYRNRVRLVVRRSALHARDSTEPADFVKPAKPGEPGGGGGSIILGLYREGTHEVVDIPGCGVQTDEINQTMEVIREGIAELGVRTYDEVHHTGDLRFVSVRQGVRTGQLLVGLVTRDECFPQADALSTLITRRCPKVVGVLQNINPDAGNVIFGSRTRVLFGRMFLEEVVSDVRVHLGLTSFFQVNTEVAERAYERIVSGLSLDSTMTLLDLYAGVGAIGLVAAGQVHRVIGIEESEEAVELAQDAADDNGIRNLSIRRGLVERELPHVVNDLRRTGVSRGRLAIVVNPPRKGLDERVIDLLLRIGAVRVAYLSCNPPTLLRDIKRLADGGYVLRHIELFDMFPQTAQVETLVILQRRYRVASGRHARRGRSGR